MFNIHVLGIYIGVQYQGRICIFFLIIRGRICYIISFSNVLLVYCG